jgi:23S rRNA (cytosine1962-C5)-methyltransferase
LTGAPSSTWAACTLLKAAQLPSKLRRTELNDLLALLSQALAARASLIAGSCAINESLHITALRLFNGFLEGDPDLAIDLYGRTLLLHNYADDPASTAAATIKVQQAWQFLQGELPWLQVALVKTRSSPNPAARRGVLLAGPCGHAVAADSKVCENGVWYALDLVMHQDATLYLDTSLLRRWLKANLAGKSLLNAFAYTGSLGVAALAGGAQGVVQLDLNRRFLDLACVSYSLNGFTVRQEDFIAGDFWTEVNRLKRRGELFDCVLLDPPFFAVTPRGRVDLVSQSQRLINKVRPLVKDGGSLVAINNALFLSGRDYYVLLQDLCADGYLRIEELISVPPDFTGYPETVLGAPPVDPSPFNHSTKIAVLGVKRKGG